MFQNRFGWYARISAYWFATSFKWFLAFLLIPAKVNDIMPKGEQNATWGMILAIGAAEATIGPALMGWLSDRTSTKWGRRRPWIFSGALLTCVACGILGTAMTVPALVIGYLILQIADDIGTGPYSAIVPEFVPEEHRGRASGVLGMLNFSAQVIAAMVAFIGIKMAIPHTILFGSIAVLHLVCMALVVTALKEEPFPKVVARKFNAEIWISPWRDANFRWVWAIRFLVAFGFYILTAFGQNYLKDVIQNFSPLPPLSDDPKDAATLAAVVVIVVLSLTAIGGALIGGRLADKVGRVRVIQVAGLIMFAAILPFAFTHSFAVILALALIFGVGYGAFSSADWALVADVLPNDADMAKDMGIWQSSIALPQIFNGLLGTQIDRMNGPSGTSGYSFAFALASVLFIAGSAGVMFVKLKRRDGDGADSAPPGPVP